MAELLPELVESRDHPTLKSSQLLLLKTFTVSAEIPGECPLPFTGVGGEIIVVITLSYPAAFGLIFQVSLKPMESLQQS